MRKIKLKRLALLNFGALALVLTTVSCKCDKNTNHSATATSSKTSKSDSLSSEQLLVEETIVGKLDSAGNFIYDTGEISAITLPNNIKLEGVGNNSTESKLFNFLSDSSISVDETDKTKGWITLDRVYFNTGSATLTNESSKQVKNIAEILKAFPNAIVKVGGYTDNTGSEEINNKVSAERAKKVEDELVKLGISTSQVSSEGYGPQHPVCPSNDTPECKAKNRRVDIRVTKK